MIIFDIIDDFIQTKQKTTRKNKTEYEHRNMGPSLEECKIT